MREILPTLARWHADGRRVAIATVVERRGSAPRDPGASLALNELGEIAGSVTSDKFVVDRPEVVTAQVSTDGTRKWLLRSPDGNEYEMVFIPDADRGTLCVSSQVGCTLNCRFCHTGTMRLVRNLTPGEIVGQVMLARDARGESRSNM